jgi:Zn-dependent protease with chaperone function
MKTGIDRGPGRPFHLSIILNSQFSIRIIDRHTRCNGAGELYWNRRFSMISRTILSRPAVALLVVVTMMPAVAVAQTKINPGFNLFSPEQDVQIGQQSAQQAEQQLPILRNSQVESYVNTIGQKLARNAGGPNFQYTFHVVNSSDINAFALPGGPIYVNRGVLEQARNEGEVAGVIAHEISHVALRHGTHQASKAYAAQMGISILGGLLGGKSGGAANIINAVGGLGLNALFLKYSRDLESQADIRGAQILAATGYSPNDMVSFFQTLEKADPSKKTSWLSDHPAPPDRVKRIQQEAQVLRVSGSGASNVAGLRTVQNTLRGSGPALTAQQIAQGVRSAPASSSSVRRPTAGGNRPAVSVEAPSTSLATFTSPSRVYQISYPSNWQAFQEGSTGVTFVPKGGAVDAGGRTEIIYGAIVSHYDPFGTQQGRSNLRGTGGDVYGGNVSMESATSDLIGQIQQSSPHLKVISNSGQRINAGGGTALTQSLRGTNPNTGIDERLTVVTRQLGDGHLIYMLFVTPNQDASRYNPLLTAMAQSMRIDPQHAH